MLMIKDRLKRLFREARVDCVLILNTTHVDPAFTYFSGVKSGVFEGSALILKPRSLSLVTGSLEYDIARRQLKSGAILARDKKDFWKKVNRELEGKVGVNQSFLPVNLFSTMKKYCRRSFYDVSSSLELLRMIKDKDELDAISDSCSIVSRAARLIPEIHFEGKSELQVKAEIDFLCTSLGSSRIPFSQVAFGANSAFPHHNSSASRIRAGDFVLCDFGAVFDNYNSDITRTFIYKRASPKQRQMYEAVQYAQSLALDMVEPGVSASLLHRTVDDYLSIAGFKGRFIHSLGHMLGLEVHEGKGLARDSSFTLEEGMVFTVEPGVYLPTIGGVRIEDDIVVTKNGCKLLTDASKELTVL